MLLVGPDEILGQLLRERTTPLLQEYRVEIAVHLPVLELVELINELEYSINKKNRDRAKQEQLMQIQQQAMAEQQMAQQQQLEGMKQEGQNYRKELDNTTKAAISDSQQEQGNLE